MNLRCQRRAKPSLSKPSSLVIWLVAATAIAFYGISESRLFEKQSSQPVTTAPPVGKVTALGRLEPAAEVISLAAPVALVKSSLDNKFLLI